MKGKIKELLTLWPSHTIAVSQWLEGQGVSAQLCQKYINGHWIKSLGYGAFSKLSEIPSIFGGLYAIQSQLNLDIHIGGLSALELMGAGHFVPMKQSSRVLYLFSHSEQKQVPLPKWFRTHFPNHQKFDSRLFEGQVGIEVIEIEGVHLSISSTERALFELLSLVSDKASFRHAALLFEGKVGLRPDVVQALLENCRSHILKRLFLYFAKVQQLPVLERIDLSKIDLGAGRRVLAHGKCYDAEFKLMLPELIEDEDIEV